MPVWLKDLNRIMFLEYKTRLFVCLKLRNNHE
jgi:hypothetical protein